MLHFCRASLAFLAALLQPTFAFSRTYTVKRGDTLSQVAQRELGNPVWGRQGSLKKITEMNQDIPNQDLIRPGQILILSQETQIAASQNPVEAPAQTEAVLPNNFSIAENTLSPNLEQVVSLKDAQHHFGFALFGIGSSTTLKATSKGQTYSTTLHSKNNLGLSARGYYFLSNDSQIGFQFGILQSEFGDTKDGRLQGLAKNLKHFESFYNYTLADRWHLELALGTEQSFFLAQKEVENFQLQPIFIDFAGLDVAYDLISTQSLRWSIGLGAELNNAADGTYVDPKTGFSFDAETSFAYQIQPRRFLEGAMFFDQRAQSSTQSTQKNRDIGLRFGMRLEY